MAYHLHCASVTQQPPALRRRAALQSHFLPDTQRPMVPQQHLRRRVVTQRLHDGHFIVAHVVLHGCKLQRHRLLFPLHQNLVVLLNLNRVKQVNKNHLHVAPGGRIFRCTHTRLTALFRDYPGEPVPER